METSFGKVIETQRLDLNDEISLNWNKQIARIQPFECNNFLLKSPSHSLKLTKSQLQLFNNSKEMKSSNNNLMTNSLMLEPTHNENINYRSLIINKNSNSLRMPVNHHQQQNINKLSLKNSLNENNMASKTEILNKTNICGDYLNSKSIKHKNNNKGYLSDSECNNYNYNR